MTDNLEPTRVALSRIHALCAPHRQTIDNAGLSAAIGCVIQVLEAGDRARPVLVHTAIDLLHRAMRAPHLQADHAVQVIASTIAIEARHAARARG